MIAHPDGFVELQVLNFIEALKVDILHITELVKVGPLSAPNWLHVVASDAIVSHRTLILVCQLTDRLIRANIACSTGKAV